MGGFRATSGGVTARFARPEAIILRDLVAQIAELVGGTGQAGPGQARPDGQAAGRAEHAPGTGKDLPVPDADELAEMVGLGQPAQAAEPPDDPILARLLPSGYADDADAAREFRRFTEAGLRSGKVEAARTVLATMPAEGGRVRLSTEQAEIWLRALNDVRLALGVLLGVSDDFDGLDDNVPATDPRFAYFEVYQWLAYIQESLLRAL
jgi:Domain of unknown function (DUF2017)